MIWFKSKEQCVHCRRKTKREFEGQPTCADCKIELLMKRETIRKCPVDGSTLKKISNNELILDRCPTCSGVWLDAGELEAIKEAATNEGMGTGVAVGMVVF
ncbi:MAG: zf-TFIIB domain-containing protein [Calditrichaeota bacterium]|nr:zf-TFIIB domain-containing protein [Calditrichota bacterium]